MSRDHIYTLIATRALYVDLGSAALAEPERVHVFANREAAVAYGHVAQDTATTIDDCRWFSLRAGHTIAWDGQTWTVVNPGEKTVSLLGEDEALTELPVAVFEKLTKEGRIRGLSAKRESEAQREIAVLAAAGERDLSVANRRFNAVRCELRGEPAPPASSRVSARTLRLWVSRYRKPKLILAVGISDSCHAVVSEETAGAGFRRRPGHFCSNPSRMIMRRCSRRAGWLAGQG